MDSVTEIWKSVLGHEHYEASSLGRVRSLDRFVRSKGDSQQFRPGKVLSPVLHHTGYLVVTLSGRRQLGVHQAVALAFHGLPPEGYVVDHVDTNKQNNVPTNLEYVPNPVNVLRAYDKGLLSNKGETNGRAILTEENAREVLSSPEVTADEFAKRFGCRRYLITRIRAGISWKHLSLSLA